MPFEVIGLHHTTLVVGDLDEARDFYGNILGLSSVDRPDYDFEGAWFKCGDVEFHLIVADEHLAPSRRHLALAVNDDMFESLILIRFANGTLIAPQKMNETNE